MGEVVEIEGPEGPEGPKGPKEGEDSHIDPDLLAVVTNCPASGCDRRRSEHGGLSAHDEVAYNYS